MWATKNRHRYDRDRLRYPSDLTDAERAHIKPLIPPANRGGGKAASTCARWSMW
jgi:hypothetical protein